MSHFHAGPVAELLEPRRLFAVGPVPTAAVVSGRLEITGTPLADVIEVSLDPNDSTRVSVTINGGSPLPFDLAELLRGVRVLGGGGDDALSVLGLSLPARLNGGAGNDTLTSAFGDDVLLGGRGRDQLFADLGVDRLFGGDGADTLTGGDGADLLDGGFGIDQLTGGLGADTFRGYDRARELLDRATGEVHVTYLDLVEDVNGFFDDVAEFFGF